MRPSGSVLGRFMVMVPILEKVSRLRILCNFRKTYIWIGFNIYFIRSHAVDPFYVEIAEG